MLNLGDNFSVKNDKGEERQYKVATDAVLSDIGGGVIVDTELKRAVATIDLRDGSVHPHKYPHKLKSKSDKAAQRSTIIAAWAISRHARNAPAPQGYALKFPE